MLIFKSRGRGLAVWAFGLAMFAAGFSLPALYDRITAADGPVLVHFSEGLAHGISIEPSLSVMRVAARGEVASVLYTLTNTTDRRISGQAVPVYAPQSASAWFKKIQCFCFGPMSLEAGETRQFPVVFQLDRGLPSQIQEMTLAYQFFPLTGAR